MSYTIVTGQHPSHPGACIAHYNHYTYHHSPHHHHSMPYIQHPYTVPGHFWNPSWRPPWASFPTSY
ncbi:hypothetical protein [Neobacillus sp. PS3-40]|uniref:hypothetical protein n=1 Tax=Neobacillus sp. PS3-40 TaxID=3070679 RepID=UPI0027DED5BE|nr:hypothetical protein [Neobacillus sp. PS3-40]WML44370.1 hypothetical protein RCG20_00155 [Neobacillus sp. PS3-40]